MINLSLALVAREISAGRLIHRMAQFEQPDREQEELMTVREVARQLRVDDTTVRRWIKAGTLEAIELPHQGDRRSYRIRVSTFNSLINE